MRFAVLVLDKCVHCCSIADQLIGSFFYISNSMYEGRLITSRTVLLSKHTVTAENQNYYQVLLPLLYITYHDLIYDVTL